MHHPTDRFPAYRALPSPSRTYHTSDDSFYEMLEQMGEDSTSRLSTTSGTKRKSDAIVTIRSGVPSKRTSTIAAVLTSDKEELTPAATGEAGPGESLTIEDSVSSESDVVTVNAESTAGSAVNKRAKRVKTMLSLLDEDEDIFTDKYKANMLVACEALYASSRRHLAQLKGHRGTNKDHRHYKQLVEFFDQIYSSDFFMT